MTPGEFITLGEKGAAKSVPALFRAANIFRAAVPLSKDLAAIAREEETSDKNLVTVIESTWT
jgi:hypothetical protein